MLTERELASMRRVDESAMPDTATILRRQSSDDGAGGTIDTYTEVASVKCRVLGPSAARDILVAGQQANVADTVIRVPVGTDVRNTDQMVVGSRSFEVRRPLAKTYQTSLAVAVLEIT